MWKPKDLVTNIKIDGNLTEWRPRSIITSEGKAPDLQLPAAGMKLAPQKSLLCAHSWDPSRAGRRGMCISQMGWWALLLTVLLSPTANPQHLHSLLLTSSKDHLEALAWFQSIHPSHSSFSTPQSGCYCISQNPLSHPAVFSSEHLLRFLLSHHIRVQPVFPVGCKGRKFATF